MNVLSLFWVPVLTATRGGVPRSHINEKETSVGLPRQESVLWEVPGKERRFILDICCECILVCLSLQSPSVHEGGQIIATCASSLAQGQHCALISVSTVALLI
jgi:hypothetical protein